MILVHLSPSYSAHLLVVYWVSVVDDGSWGHAVLYLTLIALVTKLKPTWPPLLCYPSLLEIHSQVT